MGSDLLSTGNEVFQDIISQNPNVFTCVMVNKYFMVGYEDYMEMSETSDRTRFSDSFSSNFNIIKSYTQKSYDEKQSILAEIMFVFFLFALP